MADQVSESYGILKEFYAHPGHLVRRCQQIHVALFLQECAEYNLTSIQYATLYVLSQMEGADQATVSGYVALDRSTTGNVLARLEKRGLVKRKPSSKDRRFKVLYLTRKGRKVVEEVKEAVDRVQEQLLEPLSAKEKISFKKCLRKVTDYHNENSRAPLTLLKLARQVDSS